MMANYIRLILFNNKLDFENQQQECRLRFTNDETLKIEENGGWLKAWWALTSSGGHNSCFSERTEGVNIIELDVEVPVFFTDGQCGCRLAFQTNI